MFYEPDPYRKYVKEEYKCNGTFWSFGLVCNLWTFFFFFNYMDQDPDLKRTYYSFNCFKVEDT